MKQDFGHLDVAILGAIHAGLKTFSALANRVQDLAEPFAKRTKSPFPTPPWRIVDRRLQAMRKKGLVKFANKEWSVVPATSAAAAHDEAKEKP